MVLKDQAGEAATRGAAWLSTTVDGRLRHHAPYRFGLSIVGDRLCNGAALNALQLAGCAAHSLR